MKRNTLGWISAILVIIGAINWGLIGIGSLAGSNLNVVNLILGSWSMVENLVYILVGLAGLWELFMLFKK